MERTRTTLCALGLTLAYVVLTRASLVWLTRALTAPAAHGNLVVLVVLCAIAATRLRTARLRLTRGPLVVVAAAAVLYAASRLALPWHRLHAVIALGGLYGLAGLGLAAATWRRGLALLGLVLVALPFGEQLDVLVGYPLRLVIADAAQSVLQHLGAHGATRTTILVFDSGAAQIDVPCSGVKSLWAGALLALAAPLALGKRFGVRWLGATAALALALCAGNLLRIVALVLLALPAHQGALAALLHRPLGCVGFLAAAVAYVAVMARLGAITAVRDDAVPLSSAKALPVTALVLVMVGVTPAASAAPPVDETPFVSPPAGLVGEPLPLTAVERTFYAQQGAERASKVRFTWNDTVHGSLIVVRSARASAQHPPEQCLTSAGHTIRAAHTLLLGSTLSVRVLDLEHGSAVGWFQSGYATHGDYAERVWASGTWVQVSILFDDVDAEHVSVDLVYALYRAVAKTYQGEPDV